MKRGLAVRKMSFRIDDVCPQMNQAQFAATFDLLRQYGIKPLLGVIPDNQDPILMQHEADKDFWLKLKRLRHEGCMIAMHGYRHVYDIKSKCLMTGGSRSEFAGHKFETQLEKIKNGISIMKQNDLDTDLFFAPAHSFDKNTLRALCQSGFKYISDGRSHFCYQRLGLKFIPCRSYRVAVKCRGLTTVALHPSLNGEREYEKLKKTLIQNKAYLTSYSDLMNSHCHQLAPQLADERLYVFYSRFLEPAILTVKGIMRPLKKLPGRIILYILRTKASQIIPDKPYLRIRYWAQLGKKLNLDHPQTFNEKLQWLKLHHRNPDYTMMADKYSVRKYVADTVGEKYLVPLIGVWNRWDDINFSALPNRFVLKCTHDCGGMVICRDKSKFDIQQAKRIIAHSLGRNYFYSAREWPYKNIMPRIIGESYLDDRPIDQYADNSSPVLNAYKFFCFHGTPKYLVYTVDKGDDIRYDFFDMDFNRMAMSMGYESANCEIVKPQSFAEMKEIAACLSKGICHVRVDLFNIDGKIYFNEMTFFNWAGFQTFIPEDWDRIIGDWINLPDKASQ